MFARFITALVVTIFSTTAFAVNPAVTITDTHIRPTQGAIGIGFFTATGTTDDAITGVSANCCKAVELHRSEKINGIMSMRRIPELRLKKGEPTQIQPDSKGGEHMMLIGLKQPLVVGDSVKITFSFKKAPAQTAVFLVKKPDAAASHGEH